MKYLFTFSISIFCFLNICLSQNKQTEELPLSIRNDFETMAANGSNPENIQEYQEQIAEYRKHPLQLNKSSLEELELFPFFTNQQAKAIIEHREKFGPVRAIEELQVISEFSLDEIRRLSGIISLGNTNEGMKANAKNLLLKADQSLTLRFQQSLSGNVSSEEYYGPPYKLYARYKYRFENRFRFSITGEKDPGESFFNANQKNGFDFTSAYFEYQSKGLIKKIIVGDYAVQFGQGLVMWSGFGFGKSSETVLIKKNARGIIPYSSTDENNYFRGIASRIAIKKFYSELFYSKHNLDGNIQQSDSGNFITSLQTTGYHRTSGELADKHSQTEEIYGSSLNYASRRFNTGVIGYLTRFALPFTKNTTTYSRFDFNEKENLNAGFHYNYLYRNINLFGEAGICKSGGLALLQGVITQLNQNLGASLLVRHYERNYQALKAHGFSENSYTGNESGWYMGLNWKINRMIALSGFADIFQFPWLKYQVDLPSQGSENLLQVSWVPKKTIEMYGRYRIQQKEENEIAPDGKLHSLTKSVQQNIRWNLRMDLDETWEWSSRFEYIQTKKEVSKPMKGFALYQEIFYHPLKSKISGSVRYALFNCPDYDARIYSYENDVLYSYSIPASYGTGNRFYINLRYRVFRGMNLWFKYASTSFSKLPATADPDESNNLKSEYKIQMIFQF